MYIDSGNTTIIPNEGQPDPEKAKMDKANKAIQEIMKLPEGMEGWDSVQAEWKDRAQKMLKEDNLARSYQKVHLGSVHQADTIAQKLSKVIDAVLEEYRQARSDWEEDETYKKMEAKADEAKDILIGIKKDDEDPNADITASTEEEGLIGPFKLTPADQAIDRLSRRRRKFDDGTDVVDPFMRSMPY